MTYDVRKRIEELEIACASGEIYWTAAMLTLARDVKEVAIAVGRKRMTAEEGERFARAIEAAIRID